MLIAVLIGFLILGVGLTSYQAYKRRWLEAARYLASTATIGYVLIAKSQARKATAAD